MKRNWRLAAECTCKAGREVLTPQEWTTVVVESPYAGDIEKTCST